MTIARDLARLNSNLDAQNRANEFFHYARCLMMERGSPFAALKTAESNRATPRVIEVLKSATSAGATTDPSFATALAPYAQMVDGFLSGLVNAGAFDAMLSDMRQFPLHQQIAAVTVVASAAVVAEGSSKPVTKLTTINGQLQEKKAVCTFAVATELLRAGALGRLLQTELTNGIAAATDAEFVSVLTNGITPIPSSGFIALAVRADLRALLASVNTDKNSRLYLLMPPTTAEQLSVMADSAEVAAFPAMTPTGGQIGGMNAVTTDAVPAGVIVLVDAAQIAVGQQTVTLDASNEAVIALDTTPDSPPVSGTVFTSLWQNNISALRATRYFGVLRLRSTAVATLSGASYLGNSPS